MDGGRGHPIRRSSAGEEAAARAAAQDDVVAGEGTADDPAAAPSTVQSSSEPYTPYPVGTHLLMFQPTDKEWLTPYLCLLRSQIEVYSATASDIAAKLATGGNKVPPVVGQVGIRCVHCKGVRHKERAKSSESFPSCVRNVHQAVRNYQR